jgi:hypothetical protein
MAKLQWSDWTPITKECSQSSPVVYRIAIAKKDTQVELIPIGRLAGVDGDGILLIGKAIKMETRRRQFLNPNGAHSEGILFKLIKAYSRQFQEKYANSSCVYSYAVASDGAEALKIKQQQIKKYVMHYGETPPLNSAIPDRYNYDEWNQLFNA